MSHEDLGIDEGERRLYERLTAYLESGEGECGPGGHRFAMVADFPEFAGELWDFFDGQERLGRIAARLRRTPLLSSTIEPADPSGPGPASALPRLSQYEVVREISRGGMGVVYAVTHRGLGRAAALKMIRSGELATEEDIRRFREEARRVARLDHPHIVPLFDAGHEAGLPYFTMKLMEGGSLADRIAAGRLPLCQAAEVVSRIARAVHFAHQRGILHRDIKPANILFDEDGNPRVSDFGLARPIEGVHSAVRSGLLAGTPMYMAPEQAKTHGALTTAVDVYGLGAVLYELIAGRPPFAADSLLQTLVEVTQSPPRRPHLLDSRVDGDLETICLKCLEKEPGARYGSAEALADDLDRWLRGEPILARRITAWRRAVKWVRRSPAVATLTFVAGAAMLTCVAALVVSNVIVNREKTEKAQTLESLRSIRAHERRVSYLQGIALADLELRVGDARRVETLLANCPANLRGLEWNYLARLCHGERRSLETPRDPACVAVHPLDGRVYIGGGLLGSPGEVAVYDAALRGELSRTRFSDAVTALAISPDGRRLVTAARGRGARVCDTADGRNAVVFDRLEGDVWAVAISLDGRRVVSGGSDGVARLWDAASGREVFALRESNGAIWGVAFSPDGRRIATGSSGRTVGVWDAESGRRLRTIEGHRALVRSVAFSPDGRRLVSAAYDNTARVWDAGTGSQLAVLAGHTSFVTRAVFSPDGRRIATAGVDATVRLWDAATWEQVQLLRGHSGSVWDVAFSGDGPDVASVGEDGTVKLWRATPHGMPRLLDRPDRRIRRTEGSADGRVLAVLGEDGALEVWDTETDRRLCVVAGSYDDHSRFTLSGDGNLLAVRVGWRTVRAIQTADGMVVREIPAQPKEDSTPALSDDGGYLAVAQANSVISVWDLRRGLAVDRFKQPDGEPLQLALGPGARALAAAIAPVRDGAGRVFLWRRGSALEPVELAAGRRVALSPGGDLLAAFGDTSVVTVCNTDTGRREYELDGKAGPVRAVAFAGPHRLLTGDDRGTVTIWDTSTVREVLSLRDMTAPVDFLALAGGRAVLGASRNGSARRWEVGPVAGRSGDRDGQVVTLSEEQKR
jgi:eukaryotic-like serine/threonine-protein kinase